MLSFRKLMKAFRVRHEEVFSKGVQLQVVENEDVKMFKLDGATHSMIRRRSVYTRGYWDYFLPLVYAYRNPKVLMIGFGLGTTAYQLHALFGKKVRIDGVEFDEHVIKLARKYMPQGINAKLIRADGYDYVAKTKKRYDIVFLDVYWKGAEIPKQFYREEFVKNAWKVLTSGGAMSINYAMHPFGAWKFGGYKRLLKRFFKVYSIKTTSLGDTQVILCSKKLDKEELLKKVREGMPRKQANRLLFRSYEEMREL